jgi:hypothetical protein
LDPLASLSAFSLGVRGAHVTLRAGHKARATVGVPETGLSYTQGGGIERRPTNTSPTVDSEPPTGIATRAWLLAALALVVIVSVVLNNLN